MNAALSELAGQVLSGSARLSIRYDFVLFHLLRSRLTGVHGNRLWPEVAKALWGANVSSVDGDRAGSFFRRELKRHYAKRLRQMWQQRRYLCLAFEESGAGYNRAHFIREFLERLVSSLDNPYQPHGVDFMRTMVDDYVGRNESSLAPLHSILLSTAEVLARVRLAVAEAGKVFESRFWNFEQLRAFALKETGLDPADVLPEAQTLFVHAFRYGDNQLITQRELFELTLEGRFKIDVPGGSPRSPFVVPLGPAEIASPEGTSMRVEICGPNGETVKALVGIEERSPIQFGAGIFRMISGTDLTGRSVDIDEGVRLYKGARSAVAELVGLLVPQEDVPERRGIPHLELDFRWHWTDKLELAIDGFHAALDRGTENFRLQVDGKDASAGIMTDGNSTSLKGVRLVSEPAYGSDAYKRIVVWVGSERVAETRLPIPSLRNGFVVVGDVAHVLERRAAPLTLPLAPKSVTVFASAQTMRTLSVTGGNIAGEIAPDAEEVRIDWPDFSRAIAIFIGDREFRARRDLVGTLVISGECRADIAGLSIRCNGNAVVIGEGNGISLSWSGGEPHPERLFVSDRSGYEWRIDASLLMGGDAVDVGVPRNLARIGIDRPGIYTIAHSERNPTSAVILVVAPHGWRSDCMPLLNHAIIHWSGSNGTPGARITSDAPTSWVAGTTPQVASSRHAVTTARGEVIVSWAPCIEDSLLLVAGRPWWSEIDVAMLGLRSAQFKFLSRADTARGIGRFGSHTFDIENGTTLSEVWSKLRKAGVSSKETLSVSLIGGTVPDRNWHIDLRSRFGECDATLSRQGSVCTVSCEGSWCGSADDMIQGTLETDGQALASWAGTRATSKEDGYEHAFEIRGELPANMLEDANSITLTLFLNGEHPRRLVLELVRKPSTDALPEPPESSPNPEELLRQVLKAAPSLQSRAIMEQVFNISLPYATTYHRLPLESSRVKKALEGTSACQPVGFVLGRVEAIVRGGNPAAVEDMPEWLAPPADAVLLCMEILNEMAKRPSGLMDPLRMQRLLALPVREITDELELAKRAGTRVIEGQRLKCESGSPLLKRLQNRYGFISEAMSGFDETDGQNG